MMWPPADGICVRHRRLWSAMAQTPTMITAVVTPARMAGWLARRPVQLGRGRDQIDHQTTG